MDWAIIPGVTDDTTAPPLYQADRPAISPPIRLPLPEVKNVVTVDSSHPDLLLHLADLPCAESQGPDPLLACQIKCTNHTCVNALSLCHYLKGCTHVSYDYKNARLSQHHPKGPYLKGQQTKPQKKPREVWATLKRVVEEDEVQRRELMAKDLSTERLEQCRALGKR